MANWWLVLNPVCLPVVPYRGQLWFKPGGSETLIEKVQQVHNEMVKMITEAFHTTPKDALCHLHACCLWSST